MNPEYNEMLKETLNMFAFLAIELTILFLAISYLIGMLQEYITPEKIQKILTSKNGRGYAVAAFLGAITPFCSCSSIPFLKGLIKARAGFGPMMVFLFASPLLNPVVIGILVVTFGINIAVFYFSIALVVSITAGYILEKLGFERYIRDEAYADNKKSCKSDFSDNVEANKTQTHITSVDNPGTSSCTTDSKVIKKTINRWARPWAPTWKDFKQTFPYLILGITIGSVIYGFVPTEVIVKYAGENKWYATPIAAVIGIPLYIRASAMIPLSVGLVKKGMAMGSVLALIIGSAGASLTEVILLKSIFRWQMILVFLLVVLGMAITAGYFYTVLF